MEETAEMPSTEEVTEVGILSEEPAHDEMIKAVAQAEQIYEETADTEESAETASEDALTEEALIEEEVADDEELTIEEDDYESY